MIGKNASAVVTHNWSGVAESYPHSGLPLGDAFGEFIIPAVQAPGGCSRIRRSRNSWYMSQWVGLDGWGTSDVLQAGSAGQVIGCSASYYAWYEWYPDYEVEIGGLPVSAGDGLAVQMWYDASNAQGHAFLTEFQTNSFVSLVIGVPSGTAFSGTSAEWIIEAQTIAGVQQDLPNYGGGMFGYAYALDTAGNGYFSSETVQATHTDFVAQDSSGGASVANQLGPAAWIFWYY